MEVLISNNASPVILIEAEVKSDVVMNFTTYIVTEWDNDDNPTEKEQYIKGSIKWDGCSHINFGDEDGYMHLCGNFYFQLLKKTLDALWDRAEKTIPSWDKKVAY
jgi:hypothetical protein